MTKIKDEKIIFIGTSRFAEIILDGLFKTGWPISLVITQPDKPIGRRQVLTPSAVKALATKHNLPTIQPKRIISAMLDIKKVSPDLIITAAYGQIIPAGILRIPRHGALNVHPSLLPRYRGASPIQTAILAGDAETGVTIIMMDEKMDHGPIIAITNYRLPISKLNYLDLSQELAKLGADLLIDILPKFIKGGLKPQTQDETRATYTKILSKDAGKIDWQKTAPEIERQVRAYNPWPGSWTTINEKGEIKKLKLLKVKILNNDKINLEPGKLFLTTDKQLMVACKKGNLILERLQLEGKKETSGADFARGYRQVEKLN